MSRNTIFLPAATVAVALMGGTVSAFAQEATPTPEFNSAMSVQTRADVRAEAIAALDADAIAGGEGSTFVVPRSTLSRAQVAAEARAMVRSDFTFGGEGSVAPAEKVVERVRVAGLIAAHRVQGMSAVDVAE